MHAAENLSSALNHILAAANDFTVVVQGPSLSDLAKDIAKSAQNALPVVALGGGIAAVLVLVLVAVLYLRR